MGVARWERCAGPGVGKGPGASAPYPGVPLSPSLPVLASPENCLNAVPLGLYGAFTAQPCLGHWPLVAELNLQPLSPPEWLELNVPIL